jgi:hypothetical protein
VVIVVEDELIHLEWSNLNSRRQKARGKSFQEARARGFHQMSDARPGVLSPTILLRAKINSQVPLQNHERFDNDKQLGSSTVAIYQGTYAAFFRKSIQFSSNAESGQVGRNSPKSSSLLVSGEVKDL